MKKVYIIITLLLMLILIGCSSNKFSKYIDLIEVPNEVTQDFYLPSVVTNEGDHNISWQSSNKDAIKIGSSLTQKDNLYYYKATVKQTNSEQKVVLTMILEVFDKGTYTQDYEVIIPKIDLTNQKVIDFTFYSLNDFHGAVIDEDTGGISVVGNYLIKEKTNSPESTIILSSGDMFQGSAISNMTQGGVVVEAMNVIGFDSMTMGNHEFDWGTDLIKKYNEKTSEVKANFPIICCNIYEKETNKPVDWCNPYTVIERAGVKIGIIGAIGKGLESSIATAMVAPYEFKDPMPIVKEYVKELRTKLGCELVVLSMHENTNNMNQLYADLTDEYQVDAMFNGHTHSSYAGETMGSDGTLMPYIQSGSSGSQIGKIVLKYNKETKKLEEVSAENIRVSKSFGSNEKLDEIINKFNENIASISEEVLGIAGTNIDQITGARWAVNVIRDYSGCQIGFINNGGIRGSAFPIRPGDNVTVGRIWEMMPFDNFVKTCTMSVEQIIEAYYANDVLHSDNIEVRNGILYFNGNVCDGSDTFTVAAVDYIFDKENFPFLKSENQATTGQLFRDYLIQAIKDECKDGDKWNA